MLLSMTTTQPTTDPYPLRRIDDNRMLAGVAAGVARHFDLDPTIVRIGVVALSLMGGVGVPLYLAGWLLIPDEDSDTSIADELLDRVGLR